jgi:hypothetical protein
VGLAVGVSTSFETTAGLPDAYCEACTAIDSLHHGGGAMALPGLSAFDYLTLRSDSTTHRLIAPAIRRIVEDDTAAGGALTQTLVAYAAANLNAKVGRSVCTSMSTPRTTDSPGSRRRPAAICAISPMCKSC